MWCESPLSLQTWAYVWSTLTRQSSFSGNRLNLSSQAVVTYFLVKSSGVPFRRNFQTSYSKVKDERGKARFPPDRHIRRRIYKEGKASLHKGRSAPSNRSIENIQLPGRPLFPLKGGLSNPRSKLKRLLQDLRRIANKGDSLFTTRISQSQSSGK